MHPSLHLFLSSGMMSGTLIVFLSSHWFFMWLGLEMNTLAFLPLLISPHTPRSSEATTKYFLVQAVASILILLGALIQASWTNSWLVSTPTITPAILIILLALTIKLAIPPCHSWLPDVLQGIPLSTGLILSTWQKLAPFNILLSLQFSPMCWIFLPLGILSVLVGGYGGLNQTQIRKLLAFSSIAHMGWSMMIIPFLPPLGTLNLLMYLSMTATIFISLEHLQVFNLSNLSNALNFAPWLTIQTLILMLSLAGLPPLTGFLGKWLIFQEFIYTHNFFATVPLILGNLLALFFYLRISYMVFLTLSPQHMTSALTWRTVPRPLKNIFFLVLVVISTCTLPFFSLWFSLVF